MQRKEQKEYRAWKAMKARCNAPSVNKGNYKINNIKVCQEWANSYDVFLKDMGVAPASEYSLDRIDNSKGYNKENCRWATASEQTKNRGSFNRIYIIDGEAKVLKDWARTFGINYTTLISRLRRGMSFEEAIQEDPYGFLIEYNGKKQTLKEWCIELGLKYSTTVDRTASSGWSYERAFTTPTPNS